MTCGRGVSWVRRKQSSWGQHGAHLGPVGPRWAPWTLLSGPGCRQVEGSHSEKCVKWTSFNTFNSLAAGRCYSNSNIFNLVTKNGSLGTHCEIALRWMPQNVTNETWTLVQAIVWCRQATRHYLSQRWPRYISTYIYIGHRGLNEWSNISTL